MVTGHYYFDEMRSFFKLVQNQPFALMKLNIAESQQLHQQQSRKRECEIKSP
jgi:hypothetical protein